MLSNTQFRGTDRDIDFTGNPAAKIAGSVWWIYGRGQEIIED